MSNGSIFNYVNTQPVYTQTGRQNVRLRMIQEQRYQKRCCSELCACHGATRESCGCRKKKKGRTPCSASVSILDREREVYFLFKLSNLLFDGVFCVYLHAAASWACGELPGSSAELCTGADGQHLHGI